MFAHGAFMVDLRATGECVGQVDRSNVWPLDSEKDLEWLLYYPNEGHGYATEAAKALRVGNF
ncbi:MAG TPA: hypothetical protein VIL88_06490 [Devosia sp.]|jgi:RimJ/RimL family protein N-acetyltransferase|uniref:hypothetical protein n=1 Tax=Devosia sp. TaxID=1871048 RepID=UPI002F952202